MKYQWEVWVKRWLDGRTDGWMDGWIDVVLDGWLCLARVHVKAKNNKVLVYTKDMPWRSRHRHRRRLSNNQLSWKP